jgi:uncharacterized protein (TIGR02596 family)
MGFPIRRRVLRHSFSLLEMLLVLAVTAIVVGMATAGYSQIIQSTAVTTGAATLEDALTLGRESAMAQNTTVEVRLYDIPPQPGAAPDYNAVQLHWVKADKTSPPVAGAMLLSSWIAIDATAAYSPLIALNRQIATPDAADPRLDSDTRVFHFLPDGSTDLNPATNWFMTVRAASQSDPAHFPSNWACIRVDPTTGRAQIYRP